MSNKTGSHAAVGNKTEKNLTVSCRQTGGCIGQRKKEQKCDISSIESTNKHEGRKAKEIQKGDQQIKVHW